MYKRQRPACPPILYGCKYLNFSRSNSELDLITRRVIKDLEQGDVTDEILAEYANPDSEKYQQMLDEICKRLKFTSLRYHRLDDLIESIEMCIRDRHLYMSIIIRLRIPKC